MNCWIENLTVDLEIMSGLFTVYIDNVFQCFALVFFFLGLFCNGKNSPNVASFSLLLVSFLVLSFLLLSY